MGTDPNLLMHLVNAPGLAGAGVFAGQQQAMEQAGGRQALQINALKMGDLRQKQELEQQRQAATAEYLANPSPQALSNLMARFPEQAEAYRKAWDVKDGAQRTADMGQLGSIVSAIDNKRPDLVANLLRQRRDAEKAKGVDTADIDHILDGVTKGDPAAIKTLKGFALAQLAAADPDKFAANYAVADKDGKAFTLGPGMRRYDPDGKLVAEAPFAPRPITVGEGDTVVEYQPKGGDSASGGGSSGGAASALRSNPGALKDGPFARSQPGYTGSSGGFATFETEAQGRSAQMRLLDQNYIRKGFNTPAKIVERYAPRGGENSDASVNNYAAYIAGKLGIGVDDPIAPNAVPKLAQAMREFETGNRSGSQSGGGARVIAQGAPKPGYQLMTPAENEAAGLDPNVRYQRGPDGQITALGGQSKAQLKPVPAPIVTRVLDNRKAVRNIDGALTEIAKYPKGVGFGTGGFGLWDPNRTDPKGTDVRSAIANIGSLLIHDRSGAAVTIAETPRLIPFVPQVTDSAATAKKKLARLRSEIASLNDDYELQYSEEQGFKPIPQSRAVPVRVRTVQQAQKLAPGTLYVAPDGKVRRR